MELRKDVGNEFDLAKRRMEVAREDLETAQSNLEAKHYRAANNRAYYSIYHSITAVFALESRAYKNIKILLQILTRIMLKQKFFLVH